MGKLLEYSKHGLLLLTISTLLVTWTMWTKPKDGIYILKSEIKKIRNIVENHKESNNLTMVEKEDIHLREKENIRASMRPETDEQGAELSTAGSNLILFSTWGMKKGKAHIRKNILLNWMQWKPRITPVLFTAHAQIEEEASTYNWHILNATETGCKDAKLPTLRGMFSQVMTKFGNTTKLFGFANGDILFDEGLNATIAAFIQRESEIMRTHPVFLLVKRINVEVKENLVLSDISQVGQLAKTGQYPGEGSSDLFVANHLFPWEKVPELVVGRIAFGMWMVEFARANDVITYDLTKTVTAVHMTDSYGIHESSRVSNIVCNKELINRKGLKPKSYQCGFIECSSKQSAYDENHNIVFKIVDPKTLHPMCNLCND